MGESLTGFDNDFTDIIPKHRPQKKKKTGLHQNLKLLCLKQHNQQSETAI